MADGREEYVEKTEERMGVTIEIGVSYHILPALVSSLL